MGIFHPISFNDCLQETHTHTHTHTHTQFGKHSLGKAKNLYPIFSGECLMVTFTHFTVLILHFIYPTVT